MRKSEEKWGKAGKSWKKLEKVRKNGEKWGRWEKVFFLILDKMAAGCHFGLDDNVSYRTRLRYLDE